MQDQKVATKPKTASTTTTVPDKAVTPPNLETMQKRNTTTVLCIEITTSKVVVVRSDLNKPLIVQNRHIATVIKAKKGELEYLQIDFDDVCILINVLNVMVNVY